MHYGISVWLNKSILNYDRPISKTNASETLRENAHIDRLIYLGYTGIFKPTTASILAWTTDMGRRKYPQSRN